MKVLFIRSHTHRKNYNFILKCKKIKFFIVDNNYVDNIEFDMFDAVYSPCFPINVQRYPNTKFIFGPQFSVLPDNKLNMIKDHKKSVYNLLSDWVLNLWKLFPISDGINFVKLPFGVDTEKFIDTKDIKDRNQVLVYFKRRNPNELETLKNLLNEKNITFRVFDHINGYDEKVFLDYLQNSKYGIWLDAHESQGFALQETLSCNVPLLVWNVTSMDQEYGSNYEKYKTTTIPYWDNRCGESFYNIEEFEVTYNKFMENIDNYKPREFILENLSVEVCENKLIDLINNM
jgi:hypothetical protein